MLINKACKKKILLHCTSFSSFRLRPFGIMKMHSEIGIRLQNIQAYPLGRDTMDIGLGHEQNELIRFYRQLL